MDISRRTQDSCNEHRRECSNVQPGTLSLAVKQIRSTRKGYVLDDAYEASFLIGAGGTRCPVYRELFREANPRARELQTATLEHEFEWDWQDRDCHLWFFDHGLPGYAWYVPKAGGWINVGLGGMAERIKRSGRDLREHWQRFVAKLDRKLLPHAEYEPAGYSYYGGKGGQGCRVEQLDIPADDRCTDRVCTAKG